MQATQFVTVGDASIAYDISGSGHPVVLIHAGIADRRMWDDQVSAFAGRFTVIRYDARGFGETRRPPSEFVAYRDVLGFLDHLGYERAHLVGASMGSSIAIDTAVAAPDRVTALVAVSARTGTPVSDTLRSQWDAVNALFEAGDIEGANEFELKMWIDGPNRGPDAVPAEMRERVREMNRALLTRDDTEDNEQEPDPPTESGLEDIQCPTLIVWGDQDVADVIAASPALAAKIPSAATAVIAGTAHLPNMEQPARFNQIVIDFLESVAVV